MVDFNFDCNFDRDFDCDVDGARRADGLHMHTRPCLRRSATGVPRSVSNGARARREVGMPEADRAA
ncbi:hypothetical protein [Paraburkholderia kururiensis]|uniref:hypothetical protein n=1 Tax=Paraburkholderia kururiensis TaxID=984307 RepID=UPI000F86EACE|nr:hypothetical protein [Paraburkholderia kururiensis]